jgi:hypothetical protein
MAQARRERTPRIRIYYERNPAHDVVHASGVVGGPTPQGELYLAMFSERAPIPEEITYGLPESRILGPEISREQRQQGFVRNISSEVIMSLTTARALQRWLNQNVKALEQALGLEGPDDAPTD